MLRDGIESGSDYTTSILVDGTDAGNLQVSGDVAAINTPDSARVRPSADAFRVLERDRDAAKSSVGAFIAAGQQNLAQFIRNIFGSNQKKEEKHVA